MGISFLLSRAYIELIHDEYVKLIWPGSHHISSSQYRDVNLLDSAVNRPFYTFGGNELYPSVLEKSAALFHSLVCNHCFEDGNKRTAVIALDLFLAANGHVLTLSQQKIYPLAKAVASHNELGLSPQKTFEHIVKTLKPQTNPIESLKPIRTSEAQKAFDLYNSLAESVRQHLLNRPKVIG